MRKLLLALLLIPAIANATDLNICVSSNGSAMARAKCKRGEAKFNKNALSIKSVFDLSKCTKREATNSGIGAVVGSVGCLTNEFVAASGCYVTLPAIVTATKLQSGSNSTLGPDTYGIVSCLGWDLGGNFQYTITAQAFCCQP